MRTIIYNIITNVCYRNKIFISKFFEKILKKTGCEFFAIVTSRMLPSEKQVEILKTQYIYI